MIEEFKKMSKEEQQEFSKLILNVGNEPKKYDKKTIGKYECFVLDYDAEKKETTYCMCNVLPEEDIKTYFTDKWYLRECNKQCVRFNSDIRNNNFKDSYIYKILNDEFKNCELKNLELVGDVRLLTKAEVENLDMEHRKTSGYGFWTMTPFEEILEYGGYAYVFYVYSFGDLNGASVNRTFGVRPVFTVKEER